MKIFIGLVLFFLSSIVIHADGDTPAKPVKTSLQYLKNDGRHFLAFTMRHHPHWHTYWINPGDAGLPTEIKISGINTKELQWPVPKMYMEKGEIQAFGYEKEITRFLEIPKMPNSQKDLKLNSHWLVCKHICIPGKVEILGKLSSNSLSQVKNNDFQVSPEVLKKRLRSLPTLGKWPKDLTISFHKGAKDNTLELHYNENKRTQLPAQSNLLFPFKVNLVTFEHEKLQLKNGVVGKLGMEWDGEYEDPEIPLPKDGKFQKPMVFKFLYTDPVSGKPTIISRSFSSFESAKTVAATPLSTSEKKTSTPPPTKESNKSFFFYLLMAFIGGLILNIMPCVLPVISLKLFGLMAHSDESPKMILRHNLFYTLGVLSTFLALALVVIAIKSTGESVGWGFQLQSPRFVAIMIIVLFILGLNMFGLFEFQTPGGKTLGNVELKNGVAGDFMGGVLATILSTPCSAPFLGAALTFAFTSSNLTVITIFLMIGLGLAFPFLLTGFFPKLISFLPKPGLWMEHVKKFLALTLFLTAIWLMDVFSAQVGSSLAIIKLNTGLLFLFFAFYFQKNISNKFHWRIFFFILPIFFMGHMFTSDISSSAVARSELLNDKHSAEGLNWIPWSQEKMQELSNKGKYVFMDFTAKWCVTCKVNEKLVINTDGFRALVKEKDLELLLGDYTNYDPKIDQFLKANGYVGVPAYFIQKPDGTLIKLGETISISEINSHLPK